MGTSASSVYCIPERNRCRSPGLTLPLSCGLAKFGQSLSKSVGAKGGDHCIFWVNGEIRRISRAKWQEMALWLCVCSGHTFAHEWAEHQATGKDQYVHDMYTNVRAFKSKLTLFSRNISSKYFTHFPTLAVQKEASETRRNAANRWKTCTENSIVVSVTLKNWKVTSASVLSPVHKNLKQHRRSCS